MNLKVYISIILSLYFLVSLPAIPQDIIPPEKPVINYVTIDTLTGYTLIQWTESSSPDVEWYYLYYEIPTLSGSEGVKFDSVAPGINLYIHQVLSGKDPLVYTVSAIDSSGNESLRTPGFHQTMFVSTEYDSCRNAINLSWNPYLGWDENLSGYRIYSRSTGLAYTSPYGVNKNQNSFRFENINQNTHYFFFVEALKNDTLVSRSNIASKYTYMPGPPDNFNLLMVNVLSENTAEIRFEFADTSGMNDFRLLRSIDKNADFISVASGFDLLPGENVFIDSIVTGVEKYFYKIGAINSCRQLESSTNLGTNILLKGINDENQNILNWNFYEYWDNGVEEYRIINLNDPANPLVIETTGPTDNNFTHDLQDFFGTGYPGNVIYQVSAKQAGTDIFSNSNIISLDSPSQLSIPSAFTPNNDGKNDIFRPLFSLYPEKYLMLIYDRYGIIVYKSENPAEGWDGSVNGGEMAIEGVYVYHIQYTSHTGTSAQKTGQVTLFYP